MLEKILSIGRVLTPKCLTPLGHQIATRLVAAAVQRHHRQWLPKILSHYEGKAVTTEQQEALDYLRQYGIDIFPYRRLRATKSGDVAVMTDPELSLSYVMMDGKRLYYPADMTHSEIQWGYHEEQVVSQHLESPHRYLTQTFKAEADDIVVDCGAAEGNFALDVVDKVKKVYLFEPAERWQKPLNATFAPWKDKVVIVRKLLSNETNEASVSLDDYFAGSKEVPTMIKMDIEGYEECALRSAERLLRADNGIRKVTVCTYHRQDDEETLGTFLRDCGFKTETSKGYMVVVYDDDVKPPYLRRGIIRAQKS